MVSYNPDRLTPLDSEKPKDLFHSRVSYIVNTASRYSLFPISALKFDYKTSGCSVKTVDVGIKRHLKWSFLLADIPKIVIGADFLNYYDLLYDVKSRRLIDNQSKAATFNEEKFDPKRIFTYADLVAELKSDLRGDERPEEMLRKMERYVPPYGIEDINWKVFLLDHIPNCVSSALKESILNLTLHEIALQAERIYKVEHSKYDHRLYINDPKTGFNFLIDSATPISQIPFSYYGLSYQNEGSVIEKTEKINLGFRDELTWTFKLTDIKIPVIGIDFLSHFNLTIDIRRKMLIKNYSLANNLSY